MTAHEQTRPISIRKAELRDSETILSCLAAAFAPYRDQYTPDAFLDTILSPETIHTRLAEMCLFVATSDGKVIGTIGCQKQDTEEGHLRGMAVLPEWQGTGVADALLSAALSELRKQHCSRVTLDTTEPLKRAVHFYERHGFAPSGRVTEFFAMPLYEYVKPL